jgi:hypothetical protein
LIELVGNVNFSQLDTPWFWAWKFRTINSNRKIPKSFDRRKRNL